MLGFLIGNPGAQPGQAGEMLEPSYQNSTESSERLFFHQTSMRNELSKPPYIRLLKIIDLGNFSHLLGPSEINQKSQSLMITL